MRILGIDYDNLTVPEALKGITALVESHQKANLFFLNADCLYKAQRDKEYSLALEAADLLLSDGIGLRLVTRMFGGVMKDNCNGTDLSPRIIEEAAKRNWSIYFLGGREGIAAKAAEKARAKFPGINIVGTSSGYIKNEQETIEMINAASPDILFVAMGVPTQEKWIIKNRASINAPLCLGVGAFLDYLSGSIPRAPLWMRQMYLEWFWRIFVDPKRMFRRYFIDGTCFFILAIYIRLKKGMRGSLADPEKVL